MWHVKRHTQEYQIQIPRGRRTEHRLVSVSVVQYSRYPAASTVVRLLIAIAGITCIAMWPGWSSEELPWIFKLIVAIACAGWVLMFYRGLRGWRNVARQWTVPHQWQDLPETVLIQAADAGARVQGLEWKMQTLKYGRRFTGSATLSLQREDQGKALRCSIEDQLERAREDLIVAVETARLELELEEDHAK
jgi:hypothetical protein